jgi:hypothetical protein
LLIADVDLDNAYHGHYLLKYHAGQSRYRVEWTDNTALNDIVDTLFARLILLFVDVICLFLDDFTNFEDAINHLQRWAKSGANFSWPWKPRVILVSRRSWVTKDIPNVPALEIY